MSKIIIQNGRVIDPACGRDEVCDVVISHGLIDKVGQATKTDAKGAEVINAKGKIVCPGLIDLHVHCREPGHEEEETIRSSAAAARIPESPSTVNSNPNQSAKRMASLIHPAEGA